MEIMKQSGHMLSIVMLDIKQDKFTTLLYSVLPKLDKYHYTNSTSFFFQARSSYLTDYCCLKLAVIGYLGHDIPNWFKSGTDNLGGVGHLVSIW